MLETVLGASAGACLSQRPALVWLSWFSSHLGHVWRCTCITCAALTDLLCVPRHRFDLTTNLDQDILDDKGFLLALKSVLTLIPGGMMWAGVPCSLWTWISRSVHKRKRGAMNGNSIACVRKSNTILARTVLLCMVCMARSAMWAVEQPSSSLMPAYCRMRTLLETLHKLGLLRFCRFAMGLYGSLTVKPSMCFGSAWEP